MREMFTTMDARKMSKKDLEAKLSNCRGNLEALGMDRVDACRFLSEVMNIGAAIREKIDAGETK